jgi:hypothetical protein
MARFVCHHSCRPDFLYVRQLRRHGTIGRWRYDVTTAAAVLAHWHTITL